MFWDLGGASGGGDDNDGGADSSFIETGSCLKTLGCGLNFDRIRRRGGLAAAMIEKFSSQGDQKYNGISTKDKTLRPQD